MRIASIRIGLLAVTAALVTTAGCAPCALGIPQPPPAHPLLADTSWVLQSYGEPARPSTILPDTEITLLFEGNTELTAFAGYNSYPGSYASLLDGSLEIPDIVQTLIVCPELGIVTWRSSTWTSCEKPNSMNTRTTGCTLPASTRYSSLCAASTPRGAAFLPGYPSAIDCSARSMRITDVTLLRTVRTL